MPEGSERARQDWEGLTGGSLQYGKDERGGVCRWGVRGICFASGRMMRRPRGSFLGRYDGGWVSMWEDIDEDRFGAGREAVA